jgi:hypothetical protein
MVDVRNEGKISAGVHQRGGLLVNVENDRAGAQEKKGASMNDAPRTNNLWQLR